MDIEIDLRPVLRLLYCGTYPVAATVEDDVNEKEVLERFKERESEKHCLMCGGSPDNHVNAAFMKPWETVYDGHLCQYCYNQLRDSCSTEAVKLIVVLRKVYDAACSEPIACQGYLVREIIEKSGVLEDD